jgi:hypothetical protein
MKRPLLACLLAAAALGFVAGPALAVSDGAYDPARQGCTGAADDSQRPASTEPDCRSAVLTGEAGGHRVVAVGTKQTPDGSNVHEGVVTADAGGTSCRASADAGITNGNPPAAPAAPVCGGSTQADPDPASGARAYFGADDNLDSGEHDSSPQSSIGPSDGGAIHLELRPESITGWFGALAAGDSQYLLTHPLPLVSLGAGGCADGACASVQTEQRTVWQGSGKGSRDVYDYEGKAWDPYTCGGPTDTKKDCGGKKLSRWNRTDGAVHAEPGVQVYEDPDPQGSPIDPIYDGGGSPSPMLYPLPAAYAGTCGVAAGGGPLAPAFPASPVTNGAGQVDVATGC